MKNKNKKLSKKYQDGGVPLPYDMMAEGMNYGIEMFAQDKNINGMSVDTGLEATSKGALKGAATGAAIGSTIPIVGTAIGAGVGALVGGATSFVGNQKQQNNLQMSLNNMSGNTNSNPYGVITMEDGGLSISNPLINIELGELAVDRNTGDIIEEYSKDRGFKAHSNSNEDSRNFVISHENGVIIPKKMAEAYKLNKEMRKGYIRDVINKQADRELYGKDVDGNTVQFSKVEKDFKKMGKGGFMKKYGLGGIEDPSLRSPVDLRGTDYTSPWTINSQFPRDPVYDNMNSVTGLIDPTKPPRTNDLVTVNDISSGYPSTVSPTEIGTQGYQLIGGSTPKEPKDSTWTTGNTVGAVGTAISGLGPLGVTLMNGMDRNESNHYSGVSTRAEGQVEDIFRGLERTGVRDINMSANIGQNVNRNRTSNFGSMLANAQNMNRGTQRNIGDFLNKVGNSKSQLLTDLMFKGDMANAQGLTARDEKLDMNRDNYYSNLSNNLSNLGVNMQGMGRNLNQHQSNEVKLNILKQISPDFTIDAQGNVLFRGQPITV